MALKDYSTTPANNALVGSVNFSEGQAPSTVNDSARQLMADLKAGAVLNVSTLADMAALPEAGLSKGVRAALADGGDFRWVNPSSLTANGGTVVASTDPAATGSGNWERIARGDLTLKDFGAVGDGIVDDTAAIQLAANSGGPVIVPDGEYSITGSITFARWTSFIGASIGQQRVIDTGPRFLSSNGAGFVFDSNNSVTGVHMFNTGARVGDAFTIGTSTGFRSRVFLRDLVAEGYGNGASVENAFYSHFDMLDIRGCGRGINVEPTSSGGDSGYTTTLTINRSYITNCTNEAIRDRAPIQSKVFTLRDSVVENCGTNDDAMIDLNPQQIALIEQLYLERGGTYSLDPTGIKVGKGKIHGLYCNGLSTGIDAGTASFLNVEEAQFFGSTTSVVAAGGANAKIVFRRCVFDSAPNLNTVQAVFDSCGGAGLSASLQDSFTISGSVAKFGVGDSNTKLRRMEFISFTENVTVPANGYATGIDGVASTGTLSNTIAQATPRTVLPDGISYYTFRRTDNALANRYTNHTASPITITNEFRAMAMLYIQQT